MSLQQARIRSRTKKKEKVDPQAAKDFVSGKKSLAEALKVDDEMTGRMRAKARALHESGQWQRAIDVVKGLVALDSAHIEDLLVLADSFRQLGQIDTAEQCELLLESTLYTAKQEINDLEASQR